MDILARTQESIDRVSAWKAEMLRLVTPHRSRSTTARQEFISRELRAACIVAAMAELEGLIRDLLAHTGNHINALSIPLSQLKPSLLSMANHSEFASLADSPKGPSAWKKRLALLESVNSTEIAHMPGEMNRGPQPPLDGKTIKIDHLKTVWDVLSINGSYLTTARLPPALKKLSSLRNDIAHRNVSLHEVFSSPGCQPEDIADYMSEMELLLYAVGCAWSEYIFDSDFLI